MLWAAILNDCGDRKPEKCWMVGDRVEDEQVADAAGINFMAADIVRARFMGGDRAGVVSLD